MSSQTRGWGPAPTPRSRIDQAKAPISGAEFPGGIHQDLLALWLTLIEITERRGYLCVVGWCWGYANRKIRGSDRWSNHAWGLAGDINAPKNPMGSRLVTDMPSWMPVLWEKYGFRWGGRYRTRPDAMHYEYIDRPEKVAGYLQAARQELAALGGSTLAEEDDEIMRPPEKSERVRQWQNTVNRLIALTGGGFDGGGKAYTRNQLGHPVAPGSRHLISDGELGDKTIEATWHAIARAERWVFDYPLYAGAKGHREISATTQAFIVVAINKVIADKMSKG